MITLKTFFASSMTFFFYLNITYWDIVKLVSLLVNVSNILTYFKGFLDYYMQLRPFDAKNTNVGNTCTRSICIGSIYAWEVYIRRAYIRSFYIKNACFIKV